MAGRQGLRKAIREAKRLEARLLDKLDRKDADPRPTETRRKEPPGSADSGAASQG